MSHHWYIPGQSSGRKQPDWSFLCWEGEAEQEAEQNKIKIIKIIFIYGEETCKHDNGNQNQKSHDVLELGDTKQSSIEGDKPSDRMTQI